MPCSAVRADHPLSPHVSGQFRADALDQLVACFDHVFIYFVKIVPAGYYVPTFPIRIL